MVAWIDVPDFVDDQVVRAETFQDIWTNLYTLKDPMFVINQTIGDASTSTNFTSTSFADIDPTNYQLEFDTYGNDVLFIAYVRQRHSASNGQASYRLVIDGVAHGNTGGLAQWQATLLQGLGEIMCIAYLWENAPAGSHTATVQVATSGATLTIDMYPNTSFFALEF